MKVKLKNCFLEEEHDHAIPYLATYEWSDGSTSLLPACCSNCDLRIEQFPSSYKRLIKIETTNTKTEMVSGIFAAELIEVHNDLFFISEGDIDEPQIDAFFYRGDIEEVFQKYLEIENYLNIHLRQILKANQQGFFDSALLSQNWLPCTIFKENDDLKSINICITIDELFKNYPDLLFETRQYPGLIRQWQEKISEFLKVT